MGTRKPDDRRRAYGNFNNAGRPPYQALDFCPGAWHPIRRAHWAGLITTSVVSPFPNPFLIGFHEVARRNLRQKVTGHEPNSDIIRVYEFERKHFGPSVGFDIAEIQQAQASREDIDTIES